ncbi:MAG: signal peptidase I [Patescibacteria group bacterium]
MSIKAFFFLILEFLQIIAIAAIVVVPIRYFVFQPFLVKGASMEPNFHEGDYLIIDELSYRLRNPERGEVVVFHFPFDPSQRYIKRVIGLPGETVAIKNGQVDIMAGDGSIVVLSEPYAQGIYTNTGSATGDANVTLKSDEYFVLGDNRAHSSDSREWGMVNRKFIIGRTILRAWPLMYWTTYFSEVNYNLQPVSN